MKKLAVVLMIPALVIFMAAMAFAAQSGWGAIKGTYAMIATGSCLHSTLGFDANNKPISIKDADGKETGVVWGATTMAQAVWTFDSRGGGEVTYGWNYVLDFPPGSPTFGGPIARQFPFAFKFDYEIDHDGVITVYPPPSQPIIQGVLSTDHKTLTLGSANQRQDWVVVGKTVGQVICNTARVLYRVSD